MASPQKRRSHPLDRLWLTTLSAATAAFVAYFSMYGLRKPFSVGRFADLQFLGSHVELKTAIVISQILGYATSKYLGVRYCSELKRQHAAIGLFILAGVAQLALGLFALAPPQWKVVAIFLNGLSLGMVWGLIVRFLEGRRTSDVILSVLCFSFLIASGIVKDTGRWVMSSWSISESWMPFVTGLIFLPPYCVAVLALDALPPPDEEDIQLRVERPPMNYADRFRFLSQFAFGLIPLLAAYFLLTAYRDYRDNYGIEMLTELGYDKDSTVFTQLELPVGIILLVILGLLVLVKDHSTSLRVIFSMMVVGALLLGFANLMFVTNRMTGFYWMVLNGLGVYLMYVPYSAALFERMIAATGAVANAVFAIYVADALGYTGSVLIQLYKDLVAGEQSRLTFFVGFTWVVAVTSLICFIVSSFYFDRSCRNRFRANGGLSK